MFKSLTFRKAVISRLVVIAIILLDPFLGDYDTSAGISHACQIQNDFKDNFLDRFHGSDSSTISSYFNDLIVWDSVFFVRIAQCGYEYEQMFAFFPLLPLLMKLVVSTVLYPAVLFLGLRPALAIGGFVISNVSFVLSAIYLERISLFVLKDAKLTSVAVSLYCWNSASVFYSVIYTEGLFAFLTFLGMWHFLSGSTWTAAFVWMLSSATRSNGVLNCGFILFSAMHGSFSAITSRDPKAAGLLLVTAVLQCLLCISPYIAFQAFAYLTLCKPPSASELSLDSWIPRPWCSNTIPSVYGYVQDHYWEVGFLRYFRLQQLPNFLLAAPTLSMAFAAIFSFVRRHPAMFATLGFSESEKTRQAVSLQRSSCSEAKETGQSTQGLGHGPEQSKSFDSSLQSMVFLPKQAASVTSSGFYSPLVSSFVYKLLFMALVALFVMHVQVATRFLSVSPVLYWYGAYLIKEDKSGLVTRAIWSTSLCYLFVGTLLFSNFYPFT